jgi:hypothetical protein
MLKATLAQNGTSEQGDISPQGSHGKYVGEDNKAGALSGEGDGERKDLKNKPIAELEGDVAFPARLAQEQG